jgi:hypothetical protein
MTQTLATVSICGPEGSYVKIGNEKDKDLNTAIALKSVHAAKEFKDLLPVPGTFMRFLLNHNGPRVLMPDGSVIRKSYNGEHSWEFSDSVARIYAQENDGLFFPTYENENTHFSYQKILDGIRRSIQNIPRLESKKVTELFNKPDCLSDLEQECEYIRSVKRASVKNHFGNIEYLDGLEGKIFIKNPINPSEETTYFYLRKQRNELDISLSYQITLRLHMNNFGWEHSKIAARDLITELDVGGRFDKGSNEERAIGIFMGNKFPEVKDKYSFSLDFQPHPSSNSVNEIIISMSSNHTYQDYNRRNEIKPVMPTREMLPIFRDLVERVGIGLKKLDIYKENLAKEKRREYSEVMGFI